MFKRLLFVILLVSAPSIWAGYETVNPESVSIQKDLITVVDVNDTIISTANDSFTVTKPTGVLNGDVLVCLFVQGDDPAVTTNPTGWTEVGEQAQATGDDMLIWYGYKIISNAAGEPATYSWVLNANEFSSGGIFCLRGVDTVNVLDATTGHTFTANRESPICPSVTTAVDSAFVIVFASHSSALTGTSVTDPSGVTRAWVKLSSLGTEWNTSYCGYFTQAALGATSAATWTTDAGGLQETNQLTMAFKNGTGTKDDWVNVGGASKIASLTDAVDANYIVATSTADTQRVQYANLQNAEGSDVIDSVRRVWRIEALGASTTVTGVSSLMIGASRTNGTERTFVDDSWTTFTETFLTPPGQRGTWDIAEVDSLVGMIALTAVSASDSALVTLDYLEVFYTSANRQIYWMKDGTPSCGISFGRVLDSQDVALDTIAIDVPALSTNRGLSFGIETNNLEWTTGGLSVRFKVIRFTGTPEFQVQVYQKRAGDCLTSDSTGYFPTGGNLAIDSTGNYVINIPSKNWASGVGTPNTYLVAALEFDNVALTDSVYIETGDTTSAVYSEITYVSAPSTGGSGLSGGGALWDALCSNLEDTVLGNSFQQVDFDATQGAGGAGKIAGTQFESGKNHLFMYDASIGGVSSSIPSRLNVNIGDTLIGQIAYEPSVGTSTSQLPISARGGGASGFYIKSGTAAAVDSFYMQHRAHTPGNAVYTGGMCLMALNLGNLTQNTDYWYTQQNGGADHKQDSTTTTQDTLLGLTIDLSGKSGTDNYIVLASCEVWSGGLTQDIRVLLAVDGVVQKERVYLEFEDADDRQSWSYARLTSLTAASHRITIVYGPADAGTSQKYARRGRIIVIDTSAYDQVIAYSNDDLDTSKSTYTTYENHNGNTGTDLAGLNFVPNQSEPVIVIANSWVNMGAHANEVAGLMRLRNDSQAVVWSDASSHSPRASAADDSTRKGMITALGFKGDSANPTAWSLQVSCDSNYATALRPRFKYADVIIWGLTETVSAAATPTRLPKMNKLLGAREEDLRPKDIMSVLGLPCNCPNDSMTVRK